MSRPAIDHQQKFYALIGHAISQWSHIEDSLCQVYIGAIGLNHRRVASPYRLPATAAFFAVLSPEARVQMANAAMSIHLMSKSEDQSKSLQTEWDALYKRLSSRLRVRNQLAHFQTLVQSQDSPERQFTLRPRLFDPTLLLKYRAEKELPIFRAHDLAQVRQSFGRLAMDVSEFASKFEKDAPATFD